jgi:hypothetical protein
MDTQGPQAPDPGPVSVFQTLDLPGPAPDKATKRQLAEAYEGIRIVALDLQSQVHAYQQGALGAVNHDMQVATRELSDTQRKLRDERAIVTRERHARIQAHLERDHLRRENKTQRRELHRLDGVLRILLKGYEDLLPREGA